MKSKLYPAIQFAEQLKHIEENRISPVHYHNVHELYFLIDGRANYILDDSVYELEPGDFIFIPKGSVHKTHYLDNESERLLLYFDENDLEPLYLDYLKSLKEIQHFHIPSNRLLEFYDLFHKIVHEEKYKSFKYCAMKNIYLRQLLILIFRHKAIKSSIASENTSHIAIQKATKYISSHICDDLSLATLSKKFGFSPYYFSKLFKHIVGIGLNEYINVARILKAKKLLTERNLSISEISEQCGFNDSNYFTQIFKKLSGTTPKKYAKAHKKNI